MHPLALPESIEAFQTSGSPVRLHTHTLVNGVTESAQTIFVGVPGYLDTRGVWHEVMHATAGRLAGWRMPADWVDYSNSYRQGQFCDEEALERAKHAITSSHERVGNTGVVIVNAHSMGFGHAARTLCALAEGAGGVDRLNRTGLVAVAPANVVPKEVETMSQANIAALLLPDLLRVAPVALRRRAVARETVRIMQNAIQFAAMSGLAGPIEAARRILSQDVMPELGEIAPHLGALCVYLGTDDPVSPGLVAGRRLADRTVDGRDVAIYVTKTGHVGHVAHARLVAQVAESNVAIARRLHSSQ